MNTTKFIVLATSVIAGTAAYWLTRKKNTAAGEASQFSKKERHLSPVFSQFKKPGFEGN